MSSYKEKTNKKWTSNPKYRDNWERIFGDNKEKDEESQEDTKKDEKSEENN